MSSETSPSTFNHLHYFLNQDFMPTDDDFPCNINGKHIPDSERCIYDTDASGFPTGCSDGSHLIDCGT